MHALPSWVCAVPPWEHGAPGPGRRVLIGEIVTVTQKLSLKSPADVKLIKLFLILLVAVLFRLERAAQAATFCCPV